MHDDELARLIRRQATYHKMPDRLRAEILSRVALEAASHTAHGGTGPRRGRHRLGQVPAWLVRRPWGAWPALVGFCAGVALTLAVIWPQWQPPWPFGRTLEAELVDDHVHAMAQGALIQVASSDRHTVKPWFQGRIDYAPAVLATAGGCSLHGGRVERLRGRNTAVLVYLCGRHVASVFVWPDERSDPRWEMSASHELRGFHLRPWSEGGMQYWLVSDMDASAMERFSASWTAPRDTATPASAPSP